MCGTVDPVNQARDTQQRPPTRLFGIEDRRSLRAMPLRPSLKARLAIAAVRQVSERYSFPLRCPPGVPGASLSQG